jgi:type II secretory pathway component PulF
MALYAYEAFSKEGKRVRGVLDASSAAAVKEHLSKQGLFPISIAQASEGARENLLQRLLSRGVSAKDKILFTKQFAVLLKSGIPLLQAVELLIEQFQGRLRSILVSVKDDIKEGTSLADALRKYPKVFDTIYIQLVRAGEASGKLESILERLTYYLERQEEIRKKIKGALFMPILQLVMAVGVIVLLMIKMVPQMVEVVQAQGKQLPFATQLLKSISDFFVAAYIPIGIALIIFGAIFFYWKRTPSGARTLDIIKLHIPLLNRLTRTNAVVQFCYTLGILLESGVNLAEALDIVVKIIDNSILAQTLQEARDKIIKQGKIAQYLKQTQIFPPIATYLIQTGEDSGQLDAMLLLVARNYEEEAAELTDTLTTLLQPITLVFVAGVVGFIVMATILPMMDINIQ